MGRYIRLKTKKGSEKEGKRLQTEMAEMRWQRVKGEDEV